MITASKRSTVGMTWRATCIEELGAKDGDDLAHHLEVALEASDDDQVFLEAHRILQADERLTFGKVGKLLQLLRRDYYAAVSHETVLDEVGSGAGGAFTSLASLAAALQNGAHHLDAVLAGEEEAPDLSALLSRAPEEVEEAAVALGARPEQAHEMVSEFWAHLAVATQKARTGAALQALRVAALRQLLEAATR